MEKEREVITFDYKTVRVQREMETMTIDAYENLGWELVGSSVAGGAIFHVNLSFKRDRKISNKQNLLKLEEKVDYALQNIEALQNKKRSAGTTPPLSVGVLGTLIFGGGMSMVIILGETLGFMIGGIALGIAGLAVALTAWPLHLRLRSKQLAKIEPALEDEYNKLADICESAR